MAIRMMFLLLFCVPAATGQSPSAPNMLAHTFSIVARDSVTGEMGVAVQSHWFSVGSVVSWAEAGVGAVATQSFVDPSYGPLGLTLLRAGKSSRQTLDALLAADPGREVRQVAMVDAAGTVAVHTGVKCIEAAGHRTGRGYSVQANMMLSDRVWAAMATAFESAEGDLADRMLAALDAAQAEGGDIRGKQSAALLIVRAKPTGRQWEDRVFDLRVEDSPTPLVELRRLVGVQRAYMHMNNGDLAIERNDIETAMLEYSAAEKLMPENLEAKFWHAVALVNVGMVEESLPLFREVFSADPNWAKLLDRLPAVGLLSKDESVLQRIRDLRR